MMNWRAVTVSVLNEAVEAQKAAKRTAENAAQAVISAWLERAVEIANESNSIAIFNQEMSFPYNMLREGVTYDIQCALDNGNSTDPPLIGRLRERLLEWKDDFPFYVTIQRDVKHHGRYCFVALPDNAD